jgi:hypothetical protein
MSDSPFAAPAARFDLRWLALLWVGPLIGLGLLLMVAVRPEPQPKPLEYVTIGLVFGTFFGQALLASAWVALGPLPLVWRLPLSLGWLAALVVALAMNMSIHGPGTDEIIVVFGGAALGQWLLAQVPLWGLALGYGLRLRHVSEASRAIDRKELQFGIRQLMIVTAVVAVVLGIGRATVAWLITIEDFRSGPVLIISFLAIAGIVMTLPLVLSALLPRLAVPASLVVLVLIGLGTATELPLLTALSNRVGGAGPDPGHFYGINGFQCFWALAVIGALRLGGYGLTAVKD